MQQQSKSPEQYVVFVPRKGESLPCFVSETAVGLRAALAEQGFQVMAVAALEEEEPMTRPRPRHIRGRANPKVGELVSLH